MAQAPKHVPLTSMSERLQAPTSKARPRKAPATVETGDGGVRALSNFELIIKNSLQKKAKIPRKGKLPEHDGDFYEVAQSKIDPKTGERSVPTTGGKPTYAQNPSNRARAITEVVFQMAQAGDTQGLQELAAAFKALPSEQKQVVAVAITREFPNIQGNGIGWSPMGGEVMNLLQGGAVDSKRLAALNDVADIEAGRAPAQDRTQRRGEQDGVVTEEVNDEPVVETTAEERMPPGDFSSQPAPAARMPAIEGVDTSRLRDPGGAKLERRPNLRLEGETESGDDPANYTFEKTTEQPTLSPEETRQWLEERVRELPGGTEADLSVLGDDVLKTLLRKNGLSDAPPAPEPVTKQIPVRIPPDPKKGTIGPQDAPAFNTGKKYEAVMDDYENRHYAAMQAAFGDVDALVEEIKAAKASGDKARLKQIMDRVNEVTASVDKPKKPKYWNQAINDQQATNSLRSEQTVADLQIIQLLENPKASSKHLDRLWNMFQADVDRKTKVAKGETKPQKLLSPSDIGSGFSKDPELGPRQFAEWILARGTHPEAAPQLNGVLNGMSVESLEGLLRERFWNGDPRLAGTEAPATSRMELDRPANWQLDRRELRNDPTTGEPLTRNAEPLGAGATRDVGTGPGENARETMQPLGPDVKPIPGLPEPSRANNTRDWINSKHAKHHVVYETVDENGVHQDWHSRPMTGNETPKQIAELRSLAYATVQRLPSDTSVKARRKANAVARFNMYWPEGGRPQGAYFDEAVRTNMHPEVVSAIRDGKPQPTMDELVQQADESLARGETTPIERADLTDAEYAQWKANEEAAAKRKAEGMSAAERAGGFSLGTVSKDAEAKTWGTQTEGELRSYNEEQKRLSEEDFREHGYQVQNGKPPGWITRPDGQTVRSRYGIDDVDDADVVDPTNATQPPPSSPPPDAIGQGPHVDEFNKLLGILKDPKATPESLQWARTQYKDLKEAHDLLDDADHQAEVKRMWLDPLEAAIATSPHNKANKGTTTQTATSTPQPAATNRRTQAKRTTGKPAGTATKPAATATKPAQQSTQPQADQNPRPNAAPEATAATTDDVNDKLDAAATPVEETVEGTKAVEAVDADTKPKDTTQQTDADAKPDETTAPKSDPDGTNKVNTDKDTDPKTGKPWITKRRVAGAAAVGAGLYTGYQVLDNMTQPGPRVSAGQPQQVPVQIQGQQQDESTPDNSTDRLRRLRQLLDRGSPDKIPQTMTRWH